MLRALAISAAAAAVMAQPPPPAQSTWYGAAPDDTVPGLLNVFTMTPTGVPINAVGSIPTSDQEYIKEGTFSCLWGSPVCFFATGVARPYTQDAVYGMNRTSGQLIFKHELPAGIYIDNLVLDWNTDSLYSVAFDPNSRTARIILYNGATGAPTILTDITADLAGGFIYPGSITMCPTTNIMYIGLDVDAGDGAFGDQVLIYNLAANPPALVGRLPLLLPLPTGFRAICNATNIQALLAAYVQTDDIARETLVLGDIQAPGREGLFFPVAFGDLPTFTARGEISLYLSNVLSEHDGTFIIPLFPPFQRGPGPAPQLPGGAVWTYTYTGRPQPGQLSPIGYYLAGAAGVPGR